MTHQGTLAIRQFNKYRKNMIKDLKSADKAFTNKESHSELYELIKINNLGMITMDSQPGTISYTKKFPTDRKLYAHIWFKYMKQFNRLENRIQLVQEKFDNISNEQIKKLLKRKDLVFEKDGRLNTKVHLVKPTLQEYRKRKGTFKTGPLDKQRAYLIGYMPNESAFWMCQMLNQINNVVAFKSCSTSSRRLETKLCKRVVDDMSVRIFATYGFVGLVQNEYSPFDEYPLFGSTAPSNYIERISDEVAIVKHQQKFVNKYICKICIMDARYGHHVSESDGLFKQVIKCLTALKKVKNLPKQ